MAMPYKDRDVGRASSSPTCRTASRPSERHGGIVPIGIMMFSQRIEDVVSLKNQNYDELCLNMY